MSFRPQYNAGKIRKSGLYVMPAPSCTDKEMFAARPSRIAIAARIWYDKREETTPRRPAARGNTQKTRAYCARTHLVQSIVAPPGGSGAFRGTIPPARTQARTRGT